MRGNQTKSYSVKAWITPQPAMIFLSLWMRVWPPTLGFLSKVHLLDIVQEMMSQFLSLYSRAHFSDSWRSFLQWWAWKWAKTYRKEWLPLQERQWQREVHGGCQRSPLCKSVPTSGYGLHRWLQEERLVCIGCHGYILDCVLLSHNLKFGDRR